MQIFRMVLISIYMYVAFFPHELKMTKCFRFVLPIENAYNEFSELGEWRHYDLANVTCIFQIMPVA